MGCDEVDCIGFPQAASLVGSLSQSLYLTVFDEECGRTGFHQAVSLGVLFVTTDFFLCFLIHPFFL